MDQVTACVDRRYVEVVDLKGPMLQLKKSKPKLFESFYLTWTNPDKTIGYGHMSSTGNKFVADRLAEYLEQHPNKPASVALNREKD